ncbi:hypothetical protein [Brenneria rubrifaciens]|uniref:Uncharacterized protein n=1 Tax=Brenneria rubrifaciens TaxID=55213 RepID=A0A4P8QPY0_9GAMM|nr:hypothetical protein [Brenneria rubrifaciens]QCR09232.1 hypothetical protein EH207_12280 [Brenneria rubrifaciens]
MVNYRLISLALTAGDHSIAGIREVRCVTLSGTLGGVTGECLVYVSSSSIAIADNTMSGKTLSVSGMSLVASQGLNINGCDVQFSADSVMK